MARGTPAKGRHRRIGSPNEGHVAPEVWVPARLAPGDLARAGGQTGEAVIDAEPSDLGAGSGWAASRLAAERPHPVVLHPMRWSAEFAVACVPPAAGAVLNLLASATRAQAVVEVGTGLGVSGLWLLSGMPPEGVLTSIDIDADLQAMARQAYAAAGHAPGRFRLLTGRAEVMLGRLADAAYDLVFIDIPEQHPLWTEAAARLLRPGGLLVVRQPTENQRAQLTAPQWTCADLGSDLLAATHTP